MTTQDGVNHGPGIVLEQGGMQQDVQSGSVLDVQAGATEKVEGSVVVKTGGIINFESGSALEIAGTDVTSAVAALANAITDNQKIIGITNVIINSVGTWTRTRIAQGDYSLRHTAAADTSNVSFDITEAIRISASKGLQLASIDVIHKIGTVALTAHTATLQSVSYANNVANAVTSVSLTGSLNINTQANPYVDNLVVATPAFLNTAASKYVFELTVNAATTSAYDLYGLNLHFTKSQS